MRSSEIPWQGNVGTPASEIPLLAEVAAMPVILACGTCAAELTLNADRDQQREQVATFFAAHAGHGGRLAIQARIPVPNARAGSRRTPVVDPAQGGRSSVVTLATRVHLLLVMPIVTRVLHGGEWRFT